METKACIFHDIAASVHDRRIFEIVEEAYGRRERVVVFAGSEERAQTIDKFLWILRQDSFIPHKILSHSEEAVNLPVAIIMDEWRPFRGGILVADGHCSIDFACGFGVIQPLQHIVDAGDFLIVVIVDVRQPCASQRNDQEVIRVAGSPKRTP